MLRSQKFKSMYVRHFVKRIEWRQLTRLRDPTIKKHENGQTSKLKQDDSRRGL